MGTTYIDSRYRIDGIINTGNSNLTNLGDLCNAAGCWMTYDTHEGKFAVVINSRGTSKWHFDDTNVIGPINVAATGLDKLYNTMKVTFPHEDLKGENDWVQITIPQAYRFVSEYENTLSLDYKVVANPVQAELLGFIELKQSRVDKVIIFKTDFSRIGVKAGDLMDLTNSIYGWTEKMFRVISVTESDLEDGSIEISITALEYDDTVYDEDLTRYGRTDNSGIEDLSSMPAPTKPTIQAVTNVSRPHLLITSSLIGGLATEVEFWSSPDVTIADNLRSYSLLKTATPLGEAGKDTFALNTPIVIDVDSVSASTFVIKARSKNSDGVSVFSQPSDTTVYTGTQVTDVIGDGTLVAGNALAMSLPALLALLNSLMGGSGSAAMMENYLLPKGFMINATSGQVVLPTLAPGPMSERYYVNFTAPFTGRYTGIIVADQNTSGAIGGRGPDFGEADDLMAVDIQLDDVTANTSLAYESSGGSGSFYWTDWSMSLMVNLVKGHNYRISLGAAVQTGSFPAETASITFNWNLFTVGN